jgi:catechol 2,3-dioxygenase-like lactoylglutathione lyase family enzyme
MAIQLNHTIVWSSDRAKSARFLTEILGRPAPVGFGHFEVVELDNGASLDFADSQGPIQAQHYAFLISEPEFDAVFGRIRERGLTYWADPMRHRPGEINRHRGGRGVYFADPDGHLLEVITRPYTG